MSKKNPLTPAGIEPAAFRFVTQHLNHCATAVVGRIINKIGNMEVGWKELRLYPYAHYVGVWGSGGLAPLDGVSF